MEGNKNFVTALLVRFYSAIFIATLSQGASSAPLNANVGYINDFGVGVFSGIFIPNSSSFKANGTLAGLPMAASGNISLNSGYAVGGFFGYSFAKYYNIDLELGYVSSTFDKFDGAISLAGSAISGSNSVNGRLHSIVGFANFRITPFGVNNLVTPYFGGGPGFASSTAKLHSFSVGPMSLPINSTSTETAFAADLSLGFDVKLTPQWVHPLELGLAIEYVWIGATHLGSGAGVSARTGSSSSEIVGALLEYRF